MLNHGASLSIGPAAIQRQHDHTRPHAGPHQNHMRPVITQAKPDDLARLTATRHERPCTSVDFAIELGIAQLPRPIDQCNFGTAITRMLA